MILSIMQVLLFASLALSVYIIFVTLERCRSEKRYAFIYCIIFIFLYTLGFIIEMSCGNLGGAVIAKKIQYAGGNFMAPFFFFFVAKYCEIRIPRKYYVIPLLLFPLFHYGVVLTFDSHQLLYLSYYYDALSPIPKLVNEPGPLYLAGHLFPFLYLILSSGLLVRSIARQSRGRRLGLILLLICALAPLSSHLLYITALFFFRDLIAGVNFTPFVMILCNFIFYYNIVRKDIFDLAPKAHIVTMDLIRDAFVVLDWNMAYTQSNEKAKKLFPALHELQKGASITGLEYWPSELINRTDEEDQQREIEFTLPDRPDKTFAGWSTRVVSESGVPMGWVIHIREITEVVELIRNIEHQNNLLNEAVKEANDANKTKSDFLAKMSHEIRTPMNAIIGMAELALREDMQHGVRDHVLTIKQAGVNLLSIINDILDFSKIESGNIQILEANYSLSSLINDVISIIRMRAVDSHIRFIVNIDSNLPHALIGDETRIRQILINLLGNAVKYTDEGYVFFTVHGKMTDEGTIILSMEVKDSGRGIKEEDIGRLFQNYSQVDMEANKGKEGIGLGLAISRNIIRAMDGDITVESKYGKGSTFTVTLPQKIHNPEKLAIVENPGEKTALVYECQEMYSYSIAYTISNLGVKCELATSYAKFRDLTAENTFPFIFISYALFEENREMILKLGEKTKIVLLAEFGESIPAGNWSVLFMPVYGIPIANVFNGVSDGILNNNREELTGSFTAPEAKVLVVDDVNTNLKVVKGLLMPYKMQVDLCNSGAEAIEAVKANEYDIIFMDHWMPEMGGVETTKRIRALGGKGSFHENVPVVALTANALSGIEDMFLQSGFDDYLAKPIDMAALNAVLKKWIPMGKQEGPALENDKPNKPLQAAITIEGLDVNKGIFLSGMAVENYYETLITFYEDGLERIKEIRKCLAAGDVPLYVIHVHGVKSASANIGARMLSKAASALEMAGLRLDMSFIETNNNDFLVMFEQLLDNIKNALSSYDANRDKEDFFDTDLLKPELIKLSAALKDLDGYVINQTVDDLLKFACSDDTKAAIRKISNHILMTEYEEANAEIEFSLRRIY